MRAPGERASACGFTMAEAVISMIIVSVMLAGAMRAVGLSRVYEVRAGDGARGVLLAEELMTEILSLPYEEAEETAKFGRESSESGGDRASYDDIDDYDGWSSSPPEGKSGAALAGFSGWTREVTVEWVDPSEYDVELSGESGVKKITVVVERGGRAVGRAEAIRTSAWDDLSEPDTSLLDVLLVVSDAEVPSAPETDRLDLFTEWDFGVTLISASATRADFATALARADVVYVCGTVVGSVLGSKIFDAPIGVIVEEEMAWPTFGISASYNIDFADTVYIRNGTHYITSGFSAGSNVQFVSGAQPVREQSGQRAPDDSVLAEDPALDSTAGYLLTVETGGALWGGGTAAGRRVLVPWGDPLFDINALTTDGNTLLQRAVEWAAGQEGA